MKKKQTANKGVMFDPPIKSQKEDRLNRAPIAKRVALMLKGVKVPESFVVGIEGAWGSGKTSFIEMVLENLQKKNSKPEFDVIRFNPWNFSNADALYLDFFKQLGAKLEDKKGGVNYAKKIIGNVDTVDLEPSIGGFSLIKLGIKVGKTLEELRAEFEEKLLEREKKILVVIDDIDRLDKKQTREIFKLVKMNANFPNVIYLLAYDRPKIEKILNEDGFPGSEYLKKIVQINFSLPVPEPQQIYKVLGEVLDMTLDGKELASAIDSYWDEVRWGNLFNVGFKHLFSTIRDIKRFVSSWRLDYTVVGYDEVNPIDFLGIEAIRVFAPEVFQEIGSNKDLFAKTESSYVSSRTDDKQARKDLYKEVLDLAPEEIRGAIDGICRELFPQTKGFLGNTSYPHSYQQEWRKDLRICSEEMFDTYFLLSIPTGKISQVELGQVLGDFNDSDELTKRIMKIEDVGKRRNVLDLTLDKLESMNKSQLSNLLEVMFRLGSDLKDDGRAFEFENSHTKIGRLCYHAIKKVENGRFEFIKRAVSNTETLYMPWYVIGLLLRDYEEKGERNENLFSDFSTEQINVLKKILVNRIENYQKHNKLKLSKHLGALLIWWDKWDKGSRAKKITLALLTMKEDFITLLEAFKLASYSQTIGDSVAKTKHQIDVKTIVSLVGISELKKAYKKFSKHKNPNKKEKELIKIFEKSLKGFLKEKV